jgi:Laminin G domain
VRLPYLWGTPYSQACVSGEYLPAVSGALLAAVLLVASASAGAESALGAWPKVAAWEMNEPPNATTMLDSSGAGRSGTIGSVVETGVPVIVGGENRAYRWLAGNLDQENPARLVGVNSSALNPRTDAFAVTIRLKTSAVNQNIIQKGQASTTGGMWKIEMLNGRVFCLFKGLAGRRAIGSSQTVSDDVWHTVRCIRRARGVTIIVDGGTPRTEVGRTGRIANTWRLAIGGKSSCNPPQVQCQYYVGLLDRVIVRRR